MTSFTGQSGLDMTVKATIPLALLKTPLYDPPVLVQKTRMLTAQAVELIEFNA